MERWTGGRKAGLFKGQQLEKVRISPENWTQVGIFVRKKKKGTKRTQQRHGKEGVESSALKGQ